MLNRLFVLMNSTGHEWQTLGAPLPFPPSKASQLMLRSPSMAHSPLAQNMLSVARTNSYCERHFIRRRSDKLDECSPVTWRFPMASAARSRKATASDPYETHDPFTVEYEITQPKFVDWSNKAVRIPAFLPLLGLPDPPAKPAAMAERLRLSTWARPSTSK